MTTTDTHRDLLLELLSVAGVDCLTPQQVERALESADELDQLNPLI